MPFQTETAGADYSGRKESPADEKLLKELRDNFDYCVEDWREIRDEAKTDMRYIVGDPWDDLEKEQRRQGRRPFLSLDELNQYVNQLINDIRQNKRSIKVTPRGSGANDKTSEYRGNVIRGIEYRSNAQTAYITGFENAANRSYGYWRVNLQYVSPTSMDKEIVIRRIPNPDTVYFDPDYREYDASDAGFCFVVDYMSKRKFKQRWPKARVTDFSPEHQAIAPAWVKENQVQVAEYWKVTSEKKDWVELEGDEKAVGFLDSFPQESTQGKIKRKRSSEVRKVTQYITNGLEILEENEWVGAYIPIIPVFGKELFVPSSSGSRRHLMSLIRLARDPQMFLNYLATCEAEESGMSPKTPFLAIEGQLAGHEDEWQAVNQIPKGFLYYKAKTEGTGEAILPPPTRMPFQPNFAAYEQAKLSIRTSIQSAMGKYNSSVGKPDAKDQSGVAINALDAQSDQGSFHFIDNFEHSLEYTGRIIVDLMDKGVYGKDPRDVPIRNKDDSFGVIRINDPDNIDPKTKLPLHIRLDEGDHDATISTGPSFQSQREEAQGFVDLLVTNMRSLPISPPMQLKILALSIRLKDLGPLGDQMADLLDPPEQQNLPPQVQGVVQSAQALVQQLQQKIQQLEQEKQGKVTENQGRLAIEQLKGNFQVQQANIDREVKLAIAEIETKAQVATEREQLLQDLWAKLHDAAHDIATQAVDQAHERQMQAAAAQNAQAQAVQQQQADAAPWAQPAASESAAPPQGLLSQPVPPASAEA